MTIKVEREALLRVLSRQPSGPSSTCDQPSISDDGEFVLVDIPKPFMGCESLRGPCTPCTDDSSLCSSACTSLSTDSSTDSSTDVNERRVTFATPLVSDEWTRPWTPREEVSKLFYSTEETNRFRQEYRFERKVLNDLSIDPDSVPVDTQDLSLFATASSCLPGTRHSISRVVVLHNDKLETFCNPAALIKPKEPTGDDFFDNDSFWSGSLTWY